MTEQRCADCGNLMPSIFNCCPGVTLGSVCHTAGDSPVALELNVYEDKPTPTKKDYSIQILQLEIKQAEEVLNYYKRQKDRVVIANQEYPNTEDEDTVDTINHNVTMQEFQLQALQVHLQAAQNGIEL